jgi:hypothetical protein
MNFPGSEEDAMDAGPVKKTVNITELVKILRSKNAGPLYFGMDLIFKDRQGYERGKKFITKKIIADLYGILGDQVLDLIPYGPGLGIKVTIVRPAISGDPEDTDIYGCQQHVPLMGLELPAE